jgi:digeranylgeranylglycerophospholipid reductase
MIHIIGAGPAGLFLGETIKMHNSRLQVTIYEEHERVGEPIQCTGILTSEIHTLVTLPKTVIANKVNKARIFSPNGNHVEIVFREPDIITYRNRFDQWLAKRATEEGCILKKKHEFTSIKNNALQFKFDDNVQRTISLQQGDIVVGCDGPHSLVAQAAGLARSPKAKHAYGFSIQATITIKNDNAVQFYPFIGSYAWFAPESKERARIGVDSEENTRELFEKFIRRFKGKIISRQAGFIPRYNPRQAIQTTKQNVAFFLVGDSAGMTKNTTGGGIIAAMKSAQILGKLIAKGEEHRYNKSMNSVKHELYLHYLVNKRLQRFSPEDWNRLITTFNKPRLKHVLSRMHRDNVKTLLPTLILKDPRLLRFLF